MPLPLDIAFRPLPFIEREIDLETRTDGVLLLRNRVPLKAADAHLPAMLARAARTCPESIWLAQRRGSQRAWSKLTYAEGMRQVNSVTQALLNLQQPEKLVMVLSANSLEHGILELAAMQARMPYVPITPAYSLLTPDLSKLQSMVDLLEPMVLFVQNAQQFERALRGLRLPDGATIVYVEAPLQEFAASEWADWVQTPHSEAVDQSIAAITHDTVAKYLFTSGSTGMPKAATITQGMLSISIKMHSQLLDYPSGPPAMVVLDWMPWSHVASGNVIFGTVLNDAGAIYIDEGKPVHGAFEETLRNLREISPTVFSSVPLGYTMLAEALEADPTLSQCFFRNLERLNYAGARLPDSVFERIQALAVQHTGNRIPFLSAFGSTETSAAVTAMFWPSEKAGFIGLPHPGVELKLVPLDDDRYEVRVKSPVITSGYYKQPEVTAKAFDDEGFFMMGDALQFADPKRPQDGLMFSGRVTEEFKLLSGIFVRVGDLRIEALESAHGLLTDVVVAGADELFVSLLAWPNLAACRAQIRQPNLTIGELVQAPWFRNAIRHAFQDHNRRHGGSSTQIRRVILLEEPPQMGAGEITDKGYVNQRAVLKRRELLVKALYAKVPAPEVIEIT